MNLTPAEWQALALSARVALCSTLLCLPAGVLWGFISWHWNEYLFHKLGFDRDNPFR